MKKVYNLFLIVTILALCSSCNNEWEDEQYVHMISFRTTITNGVTPIYVRYKPDGKVTYQQPLTVSGSTMSPNDLTVNIALDPDTLDVLNVERFSTRTELFYKQLPAQFYKIPATVNIAKGECAALLPIDFSLVNLDMSDKWILPLNIEDGNGYTANYRKHYRKALLRIFPFNDFSGVYSATAYKVYFKENEKEAIVPEFHTGYVVDENTVFFYAGLVDEDRLDRKHYKIYARFEDENIDIDSKKLTIYTDNDQINLVVKGTPNYSVEEKMDEVRPFIKHVYVTVNLEYEYKDYTSIPGYPLDYVVKGTLIMERIINTQVPDEDQAIEW